MWFYHVASTFLVALGIGNGLSQNFDRPLHQLYPRKLLRTEKQAEAHFDVGKGALAASTSADDLTGKNSQDLHYVSSNKNLIKSEMTADKPSHSLRTLFREEKVENSVAPDHSFYPSSFSKDKSLHSLRTLFREEKVENSVSQDHSFDPQTSMPRRHKEEHKASPRWSMLREKLKSEHASSSHHSTVTHNIISHFLSVASCSGLSHSEDGVEPATRKEKATHSLDSNINTSESSPSKGKKTVHETHKSHSGLVCGCKRIQEGMHHLPGHKHSPIHSSQFNRNEHAPQKSHSGLADGWKRLQEKLHRFPGHKKSPTYSSSKSIRNKHESVEFDEPQKGHSGLAGGLKKLQEKLHHFPGHKKSPIKSSQSISNKDESVEFDEPQKSHSGPVGGWKINHEEMHHFSGTMTSPSLNFQSMDDQNESEALHENLKRHSSAVSAWHKIQEKIHHLRGHKTNSPSFQTMKDKNRSGKHARPIQEKEPQPQGKNDVVSDGSGHTPALINLKNVLSEVGKLLAEPRKEKMALSDEHPPTLTRESNPKDKSLAPAMSSGAKKSANEVSLTPNNLAKEIVEEWRRTSEARDKPVLHHRTAWNEDSLSKILSAARTSARASNELQVAWRNWKGFLIDFGEFSEPRIEKTALKKVEMWLEPRAKIHLGITPDESLKEKISALSEILKDKDLNIIKQVIIQKLTQPTQEIHGFVKSTSIKLYHDNKSFLQELVIKRQEIGPEFEVSAESVVGMYQYYVFDKAFADSLVYLHQTATQYMREIIGPKMKDLFSEVEITRDIMIPWVEKIVGPSDPTNRVGESIRQAARKRLFENFYGLHEGPEEIARRLRTHFNAETSAKSESGLNLIRKFTEKGIYTPEKEIELVNAAKESHQEYLEKIGTEEEVIANLMAGTRKIAIDEANQPLKEFQRQEIGSRIMSLLTSKYMAILGQESRSRRYLSDKISDQLHEKYELLELSQRLLKSMHLYGKEHIQNLLGANIDKDILDQFKIINPFSNFFPHVHKMENPGGGNFELFKQFIDNIQVPEGHRLDLEIKKQPDPERLLIRHPLFGHWYPKAEGIARLELVPNDSRLEGTIFESLNDLEIKIINSNVRAVYKKMDYWLTLGRKLAKSEAEIEKNINLFKNDADDLWKILESKELEYRRRIH